MRALRVHSSQEEALEEVIFVFKAEVNFEQKTMPRRSNKETTNKRASPQVARRFPSETF